MQHPSVETQQGTVIGRHIGNCRVFKGIPYAAPPVGPLRFRPPAPAPAWSAPRDAGAFGAAPMQPRVPQLVIREPLSEDCLTLNVWAPAAPGPHPVLFWVYGGANLLGAASQAMYDGASFAERGLVFVSANYRLGAFGFVELGTVAPEWTGSSLNGLRDLAAALGWVRANVAAFGGDPARVTLMGESAGGKNVCSLATMPAVRGLFARVGVQSGGGDTVYESLAEAAPVAAALLKAAKVTAAAALAALPAEALLAAQTAALTDWPQGFAVRPAVDGDFLPRSPIAAARAGATAHLDLIIGTCRDESARFSPPAQAAAPFKASQLANLSLTTMQQLEPAYAGLLPALSLADRHLRQLTAEEYWMPSVRLAEAHVAAGGQARMYRFDHALASGPLAGYAAHGSDIPFVFGQAAGSAEVTASQAALSRTHAIWARWAATGEARTDADEWPLYDLDQRATLLLAPDQAIASDPRGEERRLWTGLL